MPGVAVVKHMHVDMQKMLWLTTLHQLRVSHRPAELSHTDTLTVASVLTQRSWLGALVRLLYFPTKLHTLTQ